MLALGPLRAVSGETLRSYALFAAAALAPAVAVGVLGMRALRNEEAATLRETAVALDTAAERASATIHQGVEEAGARLGAGSFDADPVGTEQVLRALVPAFAEAVVLAPDRSVLVPAAPARAEQPAPARCAELLASLAASAGREQVRRGILEGCREARDASGRWLW